MLNKKAQAGVFTFIVGLIIFDIAWIAGLGGLISMAGQMAVTNNPTISSVEAFVYLNLNLFIFIFQVIALLIITQVSR